MSATFESLAELHGRLLRQFVDHQVALTELDLERAGRLLELFSKGVREHIRHEEEILLPVYQERAAASRGGTPEILRGEHRKIQALLEGFRDRVAEINREDPEARRKVIALLDDQRVLKELLRHHDEREGKHLYAALDEVCSPEERERLLTARPDGE